MKLVAPTDIQDLKILIIDDQIDNTRLLERMLNLAGYQHVRCCNHSTTALSVYKQYIPDLLLLDICMPEVDGFDILKALVEIEEHHHYLPILVLTARTDREARLQALELGATDFLTKPFDRVEVLTRIKNLLKTRQLYSQINEQNKSLDQTIRRRTEQLKLQIRERQKAEELILFQAMHDRVTGLPNRTLLHDRIDEAINKKDRSKQIAVLTIGVGRFREITNTLGYKTGERVLQSVANRLCEIIPSILKGHSEQYRQHNPELIAHINNGEFAAFIPDLDPKSNIQQLAAHLFNAIDEPVALNDLAIDINPCIGIALLPSDGRDADMFIREGEVALQMASQNSKNIAFYSSQFDHYSPRRLILMSELRRSIDEDGLELFYQPKIDMMSSRVTGFEALIRWNHPEHNFIPPDEFIPYAEQTGVITPLTEWVLKTALDQLRKFEDKGLDLTIAVNLSAVNLQDDKIAQVVQWYIEQFKVSPSGLVLEVTESATMQDPATALRILKELNELGVKIAIDDFGTGYSSLAYLKGLPAQEIKIDRSFVMDMASDHDDETIVRTIVDMSHNLGLKVVAEGVEDDGTWKKLVAIGCDTAQGYHMCRPQKISDIYTWLEESKWGLGGEARKPNEATA